MSEYHYRPPIGSQSPQEQRQQLRQAEQQGRREAEQRVAAKEAARKQAEHDSLPEHERRPANQWWRMIEARKPDSWRPEVKRRLKEWERLAREEDERIDAMMAEKNRRYQLESSSEYARAADHLERISRDADPTELTTLAKLKGVIEAGGFSDYWEQCRPLMEQRLQRVQQQLADHAARQAPMDQQARTLAQREKAAAEGLHAAEQATAPVEPATEETPNEQVTK